MPQVVPDYVHSLARRARIVPEHITEMARSSDLAKVLRARDASSAEAAGLEQKIQTLRETAWQ